MKICIIQDDFPPESQGGAGVMAYRLAVGFKQKGHSVFIVTKTQKNNYVEESDGLKIYRVNLKNFGFLKYYKCLYNWRAIKKMRKILKEEKPDVTHCHNLNNAFSYHCLKLARKFSKKVFFTAHDTMTVTCGKLATEKYLKNFDCKIGFFDQIRQAGKQYNPFRNFIIRHYLKNIDKIFAVSESLKIALNTNRIDNVEVVYNGVEIEDCNINEEKIIEFKKYHNLTDKKIILWAGRLSRSKGGDKIFEAFKLIKQEINNVVLLVVGGQNNYTDWLKNLAKQLEIEKNVIFFGQISFEQMKYIYSICDVATYPSIYLDPFGLINIEAMACKKPVVGTFYGGTPEILQDGITGYVVNPFNIKQMANRIIELLNNKTKADDFGENGYNRVKTLFSLDEQVDKILDWFQN